MMPAYNNNKPHLQATFVVFIIVVLILGCKKESTNKTKNTAPIANAGADVYVILPTDSSLLKGSATDEEVSDLASPGETFQVP